MASSCYEEVVSKAASGADVLQQEVHGLVAESAPKPGPEGLKDGMQQNVMLQAKLVGMMLTEPLGNITELTESNKENRATARSDLAAASSEACALQRQVQVMCHNVDGKFTEMLRKMNEMSQRIERLQSQKSELERLQQEKSSRETFRIGDQEHRTSTVLQQLKQVEMKLDLVQRTKQACVSAVKDLEVWKEDLQTKNKRIQERVEYEKSRQKEHKASVKASKKRLANTTGGQQNIFEVSGAVLVHRDDTQVVVRISPLEQRTEGSMDCQPASTRPDEHVELVIHYKTADEGAQEMEIDSLELVKVGGHPIPIESDISEMLASCDIPWIVNWARQYITDHPS